MGEHLMRISLAALAFAAGLSPAYASNIPAQPPFQPTPSYVFEPVTLASATYHLPAGATVVFYNTGANAVTIAFGNSGASVTAGQADVIQPGAAAAFSVGSAAYFAIVGNGGASTIVASGGYGFYSGSGGMASAGGGSTGRSWALASGTDSVAIGGALPAFAAVPTFNIGTAPTLNVAGSLGRSWSLSSSGDSVAIGGSLPAFASTPTVNIGTAPTVAVTGTFWQATQPVSGTFWQATQPVSLASLPAISGSVTANAGTNLNTSALALESGGNLAAIKTALGSPFQAGGSIGNTTFGSTVTSWGGATLGSASAVGTEASGNVATVNAHLTNTVVATNVAQVGGIAVNTGTGASGTGTARVAVSTDSVVQTTPKAGTFVTSGCSVTTSSASCLSSGTYNHVLIQNVSQTANISCTWSGSAAALNASGSVFLQPGQSALWGPSTAGVPSANGLNCIATAAAPLYLESN